MNLASEHRNVLLRLNGMAVAFAALMVLVGVVWIIVLEPGGKVIPSAAMHLVVSPSLALSAAWFVLAYLVLHCLLATVWYALWFQIAQCVSGCAPRRDVTELSFLIVLFWVLLTNHRLYPYSVFSADLSSVAATIVEAVWWVMSGYIVTVMVTGVVLYTARIVSSFSVRTITSVGLAGMAVVVGSVAIQGQAGNGVMREQPDVIVIGVDGLRVDHVGWLNGHQDSLTPALDNLLSRAVVFERAWTPHARTFPAWVSLLTGRYPISHGGVYNLVPRQAVKDTPSVAHVLGERGYQRLYAIDETRFSNLDHSYGFDVMVAPAIGAFDFLVGTISDLPLVNLVSQTQVGHMLFPHVHINRALMVSYRPEVFDARLAHAIHRLDASKPSFIAVHFELPHWPYRWAHSKQLEWVSDSALDVLSPDSYKGSVRRADMQLESLLSTLQHEGRLENAIILIMSDHGEAFFETESMWLPDSEPGFSLPHHGGHGTSVFSPSQYRIVMGFLEIGRANTRPLLPGLRRDETVSLIDVYPTLLDLLELDDDPEVDGVSLVPVLSGKPTGLANRMVTLETGFSLSSIEAGNPDAAEIVEQGAHYYAVDKNGRLHIRTEWIGFLLSQKQRAVVAGDWILGAMPADGEGAHWNVAIADLGSRKYWNVRDFTPEDAPVPAMIVELCSRFAADPSFQLDLCDGR